MKTIAQLLLVLACGLLSPAARGAAITITVGDNFYAPQAVTINIGDVVTWQYQAGSTNPHPTASDSSAWAVFTISAANPCQALTFDMPGYFPYHCRLHGTPGAGMFGVITVNAVLAVPTAPLSPVAFRTYRGPASSAVTLLMDRGWPRTARTAQLLDPLGRVVCTLAVRPDEVGHELAVGLAGRPACTATACWPATRP